VIILLVITLYLYFSFFAFFILLVKSNHLNLSTAIAPNGQQLQSSKQSVLPPLDVPLIEDKIKELQLNMSLIKTFMV